MSRSGYSDDLDPLDFGRWRAAVKSAIGGKRGQAMLRDLLAALDAMPEKRLVAESLVTSDGEFCTLGALGHARGLDMTKVDPEDYDAVADMFGVNAKVVQEIVYENDEANEWGWDKAECRSYPMSPEERWKNMRDWVAKQIKAAPANPSTSASTP